jgi:hypothetical protein
MASDQILYDPEQHGPLRTPKGAVEHLWKKHSIKIGEQRLADLRSFGGGPKFIKPTQREARYPEVFLDEWATARNSKPILDFVPLKPAARRPGPALSSRETALE